MHPDTPGLDSTLLPLPLPLLLPLCLPPLLDLLLISFPNLLLFLPLQTLLLLPLFLPLLLLLPLFPCCGSLPLTGLGREGITCSYFLLLFLVLLFLLLLMEMSALLLARRLLLLLLELQLVLLLLLGLFSLLEVFLFFLYHCKQWMVPPSCVFLILLYVSGSTTHSTLYSPLQDNNEAHWTTGPIALQ